MKDFIKNKLQESLEYYGAENTEPGNQDIKIGMKEGFDKYSELESDLRAIMNKHQNNFAEYEGDSYGVISAVHQVLDGMFQRV